MDKVFESSQKFKINDNNKWYLDDTITDYKKYIASLQELEEKWQVLFLKTIKSRELKNNQEAELEDEFAVELQLLLQRQNSIDLTMKLLTKGALTKEDIKTIHSWVIRGSSDDIKENHSFRSDNERWVGSFGTEGRRIDYLPPDYQEISLLLSILLNYLNSTETEEQEIFIKPFIFHGLIGYLQPFNNGNTRLARVLQHGKIITGTNEILGTNFNKPVIYLSKNYLITRPQYRNLLKGIATEKNDKAWNAWIDYNLNMVNEQLYFLRENLSSNKRILMK